MPENNIKIYDVLNQRVAHLEKAKLGIILALITLTTIILKNDFIRISQDWELMILFLPFATLVSLNYGLFLRVVELAKYMGNIEAIDEDMKNLKLGYYSKPSKLRKITYLFINAQVQAVFLFIPLLKNVGYTWSYYAIWILSVTVIVFFTIALYRKLYAV